MKTPLVLSSLSAALLATSPSAHGTIAFQFNYLDTNWSTAAKTSLNNAATILASYFPSYSSTITMEVTGTNTNSYSLASAGSQYTNISAGFNNIGVIGTKIQTGNDLNGSNPDGVVTANFFHEWSFGSTVSTVQYDFTNTMIHELGHAMGFFSLVAEEGGSVFGGNAYGPFDRYLTNGSGVALVSPTTFTTNTAWTIASVGGTGTVPATPNSGLYFSGPNALAANGGNAVPLYSPTTWSPGYSGSHLDDNYYTGINTQTMNAATSFGLGPRAFSPVEMGIWKDLGYAAVPEPSSTALAALAGLALLRRRR